jgi:hypothetical protein
MTKKDKAKILCEVEFEQLLATAKIGPSGIRVDRANNPLVNGAG